MPGESESNIPEWTVGDLSTMLRRTLEGAFGRVRVRGEVSAKKRAASMGDMAILAAIASVPPSPGAQNTASACGLLHTAHASACSRPPACNQHSQDRFPLAFRVTVREGIALP